MRDLWYLVRFFHVVSPVPSMMTGTFVVLTLASTIAIVGDPDGSRQARSCRCSSFSRLPRRLASRFPRDAATTICC